MKRAGDRIIGFFCGLAIVAFCMVAGAAGYKQVYLTQAMASEDVEQCTAKVEQRPTERPATFVSENQVIIYNISANAAIINQYEEPKAPEVELEDEELELLAACVEAEAGNQSVLGKRLVADVILNRVDSEIFPDTVTDVIKQPGQFSVYSNGRLNKAKPSEETYTAVRMELQRRSYPALMFFNCGDFLSYGEPWRQVGDHYFSTL